MIVRFGRYKGADTGQIPASYLMWLCDQQERHQMFSKPWNTRSFNIDPELQLAARQELEKRGYEKKGLRWELNTLRKRDDHKIK